MVHFAEQHHVSRTLKDLVVARVVGHTDDLGHAPRDAAEQIAEIAGTRWKATPIGRRRRALTELPWDGHARNEISGLSLAPFRCERRKTSVGWISDQGSAVVELSRHHVLQAA